MNEIMHGLLQCGSRENGIDNTIFTVEVARCVIKRQEKKYIGIDSH